MILGFRYKTFTKKLDKIDMSLQKTLLKRTYREELKLQLPGFQADEYGLLSPPSVQLYLMKCVHNEA